MKKIAYDWLPLSGMIMFVYMIQRGFLAISKAGFTDVDIKAGMAVFFTAAGIASLLVGFISDRVKPHILIGLAGILGTLGVVFLGTNVWAFGIGMGVCSAIVKQVPFIAPLKRLTTKVDALRITPQAVAKTLGKAIFTLALAAFIATLGFNLFVQISAIFFALFSFVSYQMVKNTNREIKMLKWDAESVYAVLRNAKIYLFAGLYAVAAVGFYHIIPNIVPNIIEAGYTKTQALFIFGTGMMILAPLRWAWAWFGDWTNKHQWIYVIYSILWVVFGMTVNLFPLVVIPAFMIISKCATPNCWVTAKKWFSEKYIGTAMGMTLILSYIAVGLTIGKW